MEIFEITDQIFYGDFIVRDHTYSTYAKSSKNVLFLTP